MADKKPQDVIEENKQGSSKKLTLSDTLLLAVASAGIYLFAFFYERGFLSFFGIPTQFVNVSLVTLLIFGGAVLTLLIMSAGLANVIYMFTPKNRFLAFYIPRYLLMGFLAVLVPFFMYEGRQPWLTFLCIWLVLTSAVLAIPLIKYRKKGSWAERYDAALEAQIEANSKNYTPGLYDHLEKRYGLRDLGFWVFILIACTGLSVLMGQSEAETQKQFLVINTTPEMVVLRVSGENMICAPFDRNSKQVKKSFSILKMAEDPKLVMNLESVGPLTPVDKLASEKATPSPTPAINTNENKQ